jgi:hypothetical protein
MDYRRTSAESEEPARRALRRLLANGPLAGVPRKPSDQRLLAALAASRFDPGREYREREVNEVLDAWLRSFCEPGGVDHVTLRRLLVDSRLMSRTSSGSSYRIGGAGLAEAEAIRAVDPAGVLAEVADERARRRRVRPA